MRAKAVSQTKIKNASIAEFHLNDMRGRTDYIYVRKKKE
jgi:hypothetical protein